MRLRERQQDKEINGSLKLKPRTSIDRIYDQISLRSCDGKTPQMLFEEGLQKQMRIDYRRKEIVKASRGKSSESELDAKQVVLAYNISPLR